MMMRKLALLCFSMLALPAAAVNLNPDGLGQVLIYPYYTVNANHQTLVTVVNTRPRGKAVKVRFMEGRNSREVLRFNLYLGAHDVWTAALFALDGDGPANLVTADESCTVPDLRGAELPTIPNSTRRYRPFSNTSYAGSDAGSDGLNRTRIGHFEVLEMGEVQQGSAVEAALAPPTPPGTGPAPPNCAAIADAWQTGGSTPLAGIWRTDPNAQLLPPTGGLMGTVALVQVADGAYYNYNAEAITDFSRIVQHGAPDADLPTLRDVNEGASPTVQSQVPTESGVLSSIWPRSTQGIDAISALFVRTALLNEYSVEPALAAISEWVVTAPTKRFYTDPALTGGTQAIAPFQRSFPLSIAGADGAGTACDDLAASRFNRQGRTPPPMDFQGTSLVPAACLAVSTFWILRDPVAVNTTSALSGAPGLSGVVPSAWLGIGAFQALGSTIQSRDPEGWLRLAPHDPAFIGANGLPAPLNRPMRPSQDGDTWNGLPVTGFWALRIENANARPGVQGFYGGLYPHRGTRLCSNSSGTC